MKKYIVCVREVWIQMLKVEAESDSEAIEIVERGGGKEIENMLEYSHTLDSEYWTVDKDEPWII